MEIAATNTLKIQLEVAEPEVVAELMRQEESARDAYALTALRLGVLALQRARGELDAHTVRQAGERLLEEVKALLVEHATGVTGRIQSALAQYLDPTSGMLPHRLERLVQKDGDLDALLGANVGGDQSRLAQTLARYVGEHSPLFRLLSPSQSDGIIASLSRVIEEALAKQREAVLRQFSLDHDESALSRILRKLTDANGRLKDDFKGELDRLVKEFSLQDPESALSRLVAEVDHAQKSIAEQFSLDLDNSSLSRLKRELMRVLERLDEDQSRFQQEVLASLAALQARRAEAARSTRHGLDFQELVGEVLGGETGRLGDLFTRVGNMTGAIKYCKVGDFLVQLGHESAAPGEGIVVEAKAAAGYDASKALEELATARANRAAQVGMFIFSRHCAPEGLEPLTRYGQDVIVVWDPDDPGSDVFLRAGYSLARYLVVRQSRDSAKTAADFKLVDEALTEIARKVKTLEEITTLTQTINSNSSRILERLRIARESLERHIETVHEHLRALRQGEEAAV